MTTLEPANVTRIVLACLAGDTPDPIIVEGLVRRFGFSREALRAHDSEIRNMLAQLPEEFDSAKGGGWSFLNMCVRADGVQWTGMHATQEELCVLAIGAGRGSWLMKEMASAMPGGVPYFQVNLAETVR